MRRLALALLVACSPPGPVTPDADWPSSPEGACANLERLSCPESHPAVDGTSCPTVVRRAQRLVDMNLLCVSRAGDLSALRACATVRCRN